MKKTTLRRRLTSLLFRWLVLLVAVGALVLGLGFGRVERRAVEERLLVGRALAEHFDTSLGDLFHALRRLAASSAILTPAAATALRAGRLESNPAHHPFRDAIYVLDGEGRVVVGDPPEIAPLPMRMLPITRREWVTGVFAKVPGDPRVAALQPFRAAGRDYWLVAEMILKDSSVSAMLGDLASPADFHLFLVDGDAVVVAASRAEQVGRAVPEGSSLRVALAGRRTFLATHTPCWVDDHSGEHVAVMVPLEMAPWGVVLQQPREQAFAALYAYRNMVLAAILVLMLTGLLLSRALSRTVLVPLQELSEQAEALRRGELERPIGVDGEEDEIRVLARTLDAARLRLRESLAEMRAWNARLEDEVASRTQEIGVLLEQALEQDAQRGRLVRRLLDAGEDERRRIARELHDEISQLLTVVQFSLEALPAEHPEVGKAKHLLAKSQQELHRLIYDLRPSVLDDLGLPTALAWLVENRLAPRGIEARLEIEPELELPPELEVTTFRIAQEIFTNILRHAEAENVSVELYRHDGNLVLTVEDDGKGFDPAAGHDGAGLVGIRERAAIVGGAVHLDSEPELGTQVSVELPLTSRDMKEAA